MEQNIEPVLKPHLYCQLVFDREIQDIQRVKDSLFNEWCWENWTDMCIKMKLDHLLTLYTSINAK